MARIVVMQWQLLKDKRRKVMEQKKQDISIVAAITVIAIACVLAVFGRSVHAAELSVPEAKYHNETVILMHGLGRSSLSMKLMEKRLQQQGYEVVNIDYPTKDDPISEIARRWLAPEVRSRVEKGRRVHFVTHSLGGIVVRHYFERYANGCTGNIVMLAPPNHGSEIIDVLDSQPLIAEQLWPAAQQLSTSEDSEPNRLGPIRCPAGIIAGDASLNPLLSQLIPGRDDGKVSIASTRAPGMNDHVVVHTSHIFIMNNSDVFQQTLHFLEHGSFVH